ncbi:MAG: hypothetical protein DSZ15_00660 [Candidatus Thioglobus sp.]|nr:MAG: hypothetical protein DSZ15_00660 [Candidatus Thioglobus sp.]
MDSILNFFVRQKKLALVFTVSVIAVGLLALNNIQRDQFPAVDFEVMSISTAYPGASPEDVEQNITNLIEDELSSISGIEKFVSVSREGRSSITVTLSQDVSDIDTLKQDIRNAVNRIKALPDEVVSLPNVRDQKTSRKSIVKISIGAEDLSYAELRQITDNIADSLELVDGVSEVVKDGYLDREIQIRISPEKLYQHKLSLPQIIDAIAKRNTRYTVGQNHSRTDEKIIVVLAKFNQAESVGDVIIKSTFEGPVVRLKDIAQIESGNVEEKSIIRVNGKKMWKAFEAEREILQSSSAVVYTDEKSHVKTVYGVVVRSDGYVLTKASEVVGKSYLSVRIGKELFKDVKIVETDPQWDVAMLKVESDHPFTPVVFSQESDVPQGHWVVSNGSTSRISRRVRVGIVSAITHEIKSAGSKVILGVLLSEKSDLKIENLQ